MTDIIDIYRAAKLVIDRHGDDDSGLAARISSAFARRARFRGDLRLPSFGCTSTLSQHTPSGGL